MRFVLPKPDGDFTQVHNALLRHPLRRAHRAAFIELFEAISYGACTYKSRESYCEKIGVPLRTWEKHIITLMEIGILAREGDDYVVQACGELCADTEQAPKLIAEEVQEQPKRESTGLSQADRWELIKEAWNKHKPEGYMQLDGRINLPALIAVETQSKRLGVDRDDYDAFIGAVLRGAANDEWWAAKNMKLSQVFGFGADLDDKKFENVEKLYRAGLNSAPKAAPQNHDDEWYLAKAVEAWPNAPYKRVVRKTVEDMDVARDLATGPGMLDSLKAGHLSESSDMVIHHKRRLKEAGLNPSREPEWYNEEVLGLVFVPEHDFPVYWTSSDKLPLN